MNNLTQARNLYLNSDRSPLETLMVYTLNGSHSTTVEAKGLQTKGIFDTVSPEIKKPESDNPGLRTKSLDSSRESERMGLLNTPILADVPNLYKQNGTFVSSTSIFLKLNRCEATLWLMSNHPFAYLLLNLVAYRAQRTIDHPAGIEIGVAYIGDYESIGATRQQYRTALKVLVRMKYLTILETCRTRKKSTTEPTTIGTKVKLLSSDIWDINPQDANHRNNQRATTEQPPSNHDQEDKEDKEDNINISPKEGTFVPSELATSLLADFYSSLFSSIPDFPKEKARKTKSQYQAADRLLKNYSIDIIKSVIAYAHKPGDFWIKHVHSIVYLEKKFVTLQQQMKNPMNKAPQQKPESLHNKKFNKDERPVQYVNKMSFK